MLFTSLAIAGLSATALAQCTAEQRLFFSNQVPVAYAQDSPIDVFNTFSAIPFGVGSLAGPCPTIIYANGAPGVPVGLTGQDVVTFGTATRQAFFQVTGQYTDFPQNGTTLINTNVTLGVQSLVPSPVTFAGQVYLDFNAECRITAVRAFAQVPAFIGGRRTDFRRILGIPRLPLPNIPFLPGQL